MGTNDQYYIEDTRCGSAPLQTPACAPGGGVPSVCEHCGAVLKLVLRCRCEHAGKAANALHGAMPDEHEMCTATDHFA